jgi:hypothetical protein
MHQTSVHSTIVPDAIAIIAVCTTSRALAEFAVALKMVSVDNLSLPPGPEQVEAKVRIAQNVASLAWRVEARAALRDPDIEELAWYFYQICLKWVPSNSSDPMTDDAWLLGVRALYSRERSLQQIANTLIEQFCTPEAFIETPADFVESQPAAVVDNRPAAVAAPPIANASPPAAPTASITPPSVATTQTVAASFPRDTRSKLVARLELLVKAKRFVDQFMQHYNASQARKAKAQAEVTHSAPVPTLETPQVTPPASPIETSLPKVEAVAITAPTPPPSSTIALPIQAPKRPEAHQAAGLPMSAHRRAVRRYQQLPHGLLTQLLASPATSHSVPIPFCQFYARESFVNPYPLPKQQSLSPP